MKVLILNLILKMDNNTLWERVLTDVELNVSKANFNIWFKDTFILKQENGVAYISVPNAFVEEWLMTKYHNFLLKSLRSISNNIHSIEYSVTKNGQKKPFKEKTEDQIKEKLEDKLPLNENLINKEDNLNPKYTFESFVVGPFNELAHAASQAIIKKPGVTYNPLFVYGSTGHGKTHLIQAIGNILKNSQENKKIYYVTSEKFTQDYINAVHSAKMGSFKEKYRKYDVLIMDDIQFLSKKEKTQEELFHLFNHLYENNKQIIFSSDKHPNFITNLENRLKSRFGAGMIVDIPTPDRESRVAILKAKAKMNNFTLGQTIIDYIADSIPGNIRELEGILNSIICQSQLKNKDLNINEIKDLIKNNTRTQKTTTPKEVVKIVADFYNIEEEIIYEKTRKKEVIKPRQVIMYILREEFNISYPSIGEKLGGRDHTTVIHSCEKIKNELKNDSVLMQEINQIRSML